MMLERTMDRYKKMHLLIKRENTGTPGEFARKLGISKSQLYNCLDELRIRGAEITYSKIKRSYVYQTPVEVRAEFFLTFPGSEDVDGIRGDNRIRQ
ncbi:MAG: helix-turn-helix domain-containing protein [Bacteroidales bacterium]|nr:helix-turn-helix domain-containing protein [Bacteroidales bacterium]